LKRVRTISNNYFFEWHLMFVEKTNYCWSERVLQWDDHKYEQGAYSTAASPSPPINSEGDCVTTIVEYARMEKCDDYNII
jgi:hypothetical protein